MTARQRLLSFRSPVAVFAAALVALLLAFHALGPIALPGLRYERGAVLAGEAWRLVTGHLVHADLAHLGWNLLGLVIVGVLFARDYNGWQWVVILLTSTAATDLGFLLFEPQLEWYIGFSGVLHGLMAAGLVAWLRSTRDAITWFVTALFAAKLAWEHVVGPLPFTAGSLPMPVVHQAHTYGAIGGLLAGLWLTRRTCRPASL